jgi:GT2 family glycosyltransferase
VESQNLVEIDRFISWQLEDESESFILQNKIAQRFGDIGTFFVEKSSENKKMSHEFLQTTYRWLRKNPDLKFLFKKIFNFFPASLRIRVINIVLQNFGNPERNSEFVFRGNIQELGFGICSSQNPQVTIVIPIHNNLNLTFECLRSVQLAALESELEVILVDDASTDFSAEAFLNIRGIRYVRLRENVGYTRATNIGAGYAKANYIFLLNNDTVVLPNCIPQLLNSLSTQPEVAIIGATLLNRDFSVQESGSQIFKDGSGWNLGSGFHVSDPRLQFHREVDYCSAAAVMVRRSFWLSVSGFDERFAPAYFEDTDLCFTAWASELKVLVSNDAYVIHQRSSSYGKTNNELMKINQNKFNLKWAHSLQGHWENYGVGRFESSRSSKGIVIIVDNFLPSFSRDSGSIRTIKLLTAIRDIGYHVCLTALSSEITPLDIRKLHALGVEVYPNVSSLLTGLENRKDRVSHFWLIREESINSHFKSLLNEFPQVSFITDLLDLDYSSAALNLSISSSHQNIVRQSNCTVVVSPFERSILEKSFPEKAIFDVWKDFELNETKVTFENRSGLLFVGGFGHPPNREGILWFVESVLPHLKSAGFNQEISLVGTQVTEKEKEFFESEGITVLGNLKSLQDVYSKSLISICPLKSGRGLKGKIAEALSFGLPVVTTKFGVEGFNEVDRDCIKVADDGVSFAKEILNISGNRENWTKLHHSSSSYVKNNFNNGAYKEKIKAVLAEANNRLEKSDLILEDKSIDHKISFKSEHIFQRQKMFRVKPDLEIGKAKYQKSRFEINRIIKVRRFKFANCKVDSSKIKSVTNLEKDEFSPSTDQIGMVVPPEMQGIYGHWLVDILPKFLILQKFYGTNLRIILPKPADFFVEELLHAFNIPTLTLKMISELENQVIKIVDTNDVRNFDLLEVEAVSKLVSNICLPELVMETFDKIFISRDKIGKSGENSRSLINRAEIEDYFASRGFEIIHPESLSVFEQIYLFSKAEIVAGEAGSGLHNSIFMRHGRTLINLQSDRQEHLIQSSLGLTNQLKTFYVWGNSSTDDWSSNFHISIESLDKLFEEL